MDARVEPSRVEPSPSPAGPAGLDAETCYRALVARDRRFDGVFFVAVTTTGIYCRPICTARTPGRDRCVFYRRGAEAERAGYRACLRCRPELAPGAGAVDAAPRLVADAVARIEAGFLDDGSVDDLATELGVTARHLRRTLTSALGVTPVELAQSRRLAMARQLVLGTDLPLTQIAFASGMGSLRRFNALFRERFGAAPSTLRGRRRLPPPSSLQLRLDYRPPLAWAPLLGFLDARASAGVELVDGGVYRRTVRIGDATGWVAVRPDPRRAALVADVPISLASALLPLAARLRALFDLDAHPEAIDAHLRRDPLLAPRVAAHPGLRVPGAFDGFEVAVRAILGQQVSVAAATTLAGRLAAAFGEPVATPWPGLDRLFPPPAAIATAGEAAVAAVGMPAARARAVVALAGAAERLRLDPHADPAALTAQLAALPGIGPWTAAYVAMRAAAWPDALPSSDLALRRALGDLPAADVDARAAPWRPWRSYAVLHLWTGVSP